MAFLPAGGGARLIAAQAHNTGQDGATDRATLNEGPERSSDAQLQTLHDMQANVLEQGPEVGKGQGGIQQLEAEGAVQIVIMRDGIAPALGARPGGGRLRRLAGSRGARPLVGRPQLSQAALQQRTAHRGRGTGNTAGTPADSARRHKSNAPQVRRRRRCRGLRRAVRETSCPNDEPR
jgi:hypothetical protein